MIDLFHAVTLVQVPGTHDSLGACASKFNKKAINFIYAKTFPFYVQYLRVISARNEDFMIADK